MSFVPDFEIGVWNLWWLALVYIIFSFGIFVIFPPYVNQRFTYIPKVNIINTIIYIIYYGKIVLTLFIPVNLHSDLFYIGLIIFTVGVSGYLSAVFTFATTPFDIPARTGVYSISRNPIYISKYVSWIGISIAGNTWLLIIILCIYMFLNHFIIKKEEVICLWEYRKEYKKYMKHVHRYILFF